MESHDPSTELGATSGDAMKHIDVPAEGGVSLDKKPSVRKRTKTGCLTCRKRRIKCDEGKPTCNNCIKSKRMCEGYNQRLVFKDGMTVGGHHQPFPSHNVLLHGSHSHHMNRQYPFYNTTGVAAAAAHPRLQQQQQQQQQLQCGLDPVPPFPTLAPKPVIAPGMFHQSEYSSVSSQATPYDMTYVPPPASQGSVFEYGCPTTRVDEGDLCPPTFGSEFDTVMSAQHLGGYINQGASTTLNGNSITVPAGAGAPGLELWGSDVAGAGVHGIMKPGGLGLNSLQMSPPALSVLEPVQHHARGGMQHNVRTALKEQVGGCGLASQFHSQPVPQVNINYMPPTTTSTAQGASLPLMNPMTTVESLVPETTLPLSATTPAQAPPPQSLPRQQHKKRRGSYSSIDTDSDDIMSPLSPRPKLAGPDTHGLTRGQSVGQVEAVATGHGVIRRPRATPDVYGLRKRTFGFAHDDQARQQHRTYYRRLPQYLQQQHQGQSLQPYQDSVDGAADAAWNTLRDDRSAAAFQNFINVTGPTISLYERSMPGQPSLIWTHSLPLLALKQPALLHAMIAIGSLQMAKYLGIPPTLALKHYHRALRRVQKLLMATLASRSAVLVSCSEASASTSLPTSRVNSHSQYSHTTGDNNTNNIVTVTIATFACTMLLSYFEVWASDHDKWCKHIIGSCELLKKIAFPILTRDYLAAQRRRRARLESAIAKRRLDRHRNLRANSLGYPAPRNPGDSSASYSAAAAAVAASTNAAHSGVPDVLGLGGYGGGYGGYGDMEWTTPTIPELETELHKLQEVDLELVRQVCGSRRLAFEEAEKAVSQSEATGSRTAGAMAATSAATGINAQQGANSHINPHINQGFEEVPDIAAGGQVDTAAEEQAEHYEQLADLYWWYCKLDTYQSILSGSEPLLDYRMWTQVLPRAPVGRLDAIYGTFDHVILLVGRVASFAAKDIARKRRRAQMAQSDSTTDSAASKAVPSSTSTLDSATAQALADWEAIRQAFDVLQNTMTEAFQPLDGVESQHPGVNASDNDTPDEVSSVHPFGPPRMYRTYSIAGIWMNLYMGLILLYRAHPSMPPAGIEAANMMSGETAFWAREIGRIASGFGRDDGEGIVGDNEDGRGVSTVVAAALIESGFPMFVAGTQYTIQAQRWWLVRRMNSISTLTGWQSGRQIAAGCESAWNKLAKLGRAPAYVRAPGPPSSAATSTSASVSGGASSSSSSSVHTVTASSAPSTDTRAVWLGRGDDTRRIDRVYEKLVHGGVTDEDPLADVVDVSVERSRAIGDGKLVLHKSERAHYALGLLGVEEDLDRLTLRDGMG